MTTLDPRVVRGMQAQAKLREERLANGETLIGWKVGFGAPTAMQKLGITEPLVGFLTSGSVLGSGELIVASDWVEARVEPEIAVYMGHDLGAGEDREKARTAIAALGPALEIVDITFRADDVEEILEGNIYSRYVILGPPDESRAGCVIDGLVGRIRHNDDVFAPVVEINAMTGDLVDIVRLVADTLAAAGEKLRAGELIITGSIVPPIVVTESSVVDFTLDPMEMLRASLAV